MEKETLIKFMTNLIALAKGNFIFFIVKYRYCSSSDSEITWSFNLNDLSEQFLRRHCI